MGWNGLGWIGCTRIRMPHRVHNVHLQNAAVTHFCVIDATDSVTVFRLSLPSKLFQLLLLLLLPVLVLLPVLWSLLLLPCIRMRAREYECMN